MSELNELGRRVPELGRIELVQVRDVWQDEARDVTPWLKDNLRLLGEALGMEPDALGRETPVGDFSLDILAQVRGTERKVAIENQLGKTDHSHLGQALTYAAGCDASVVIWVTPDFRPEHREALDWLNRWTPEEIEFYGVEVRAVRIGDSLRAPEFRPVAFPNHWTKDARRKASGAASPDREQQLEFFTPLSERLVRERVAPQVLRYKGVPRIIPSGVPHTNYSIYLAGEYIQVHLWINAGSSEATNRIFDSLKAESEVIEAEFGASEFKWVWDRQDNCRWACVGIRRDGSLNEPERWEELRAWVVEHLPRFQNVISSRLEKIIDGLETGAEAPVLGPDA